MTTEEIKAIWDKFSTEHATGSVHDFDQMMDFFEFKKAMEFILSEQPKQEPDYWIQQNETTEAVVTNAEYKELTALHGEPWIAVYKSPPPSKGEVKDEFGTTL